jgi:hypothetical protein
MILYVSSVFTKVYRNDLGAAQLGFDGGPDRVRLMGLPGLSDCGDMVDIHTEFNHGVEVTQNE